LTWPALDAGSRSTVSANAPLPESQRVQFLRQLQSSIDYRGHLVGAYRLDFPVEGELVVELKSVERMDYVYVSQMLTCLKATASDSG
jgi:GxxExxY protein